VFCLIFFLRGNWGVALATLATPGYAPLLGRGRVWPLKHAPPHMCYHAEYGHSTSKSEGVARGGVIPMGRAAAALRPRPLGRRCAWPLTNPPFHAVGLPWRISFFVDRTMRTYVYGDSPENQGSSNPAFQGRSKSSMKLIDRAPPINVP